MPDSAQKILIDIASVSRRVVSILTQHAGRKTVESFRLDRIVIGSNTVLTSLNRTLLLKDSMLDDRLADWLASKEPQICLDTLNQMESLLHASGTPHDYGAKSLFRTSSSRSVAVKGESSGAIGLFKKRKDYFHFLLTTDIWEGVHQQVVSQSVDARNVAPIPIARQVQCSATPRHQAIDLGKLNVVLTWLSAWKSKATHERTTLLRQPDTCAWLPNTRAYKIWRDTENSFLWLNGKAGAGKSVLTASVIEGLESTLRDGEILVFFYCDFRDERSTSAVEIMRSLLSQLLQRFSTSKVEPGDIIDELIKQKDEGASIISDVTLLARRVSQAAKQFYQQPLVVIDALDECKDVEELLRGLVELNKGGIQLFVTSRPLQVVKDCFRGLPSISMDAMKFEVSADINLHVTRELDSHRRLRILNADLKQEINSVLCEKADGMFRWVQCQLNVLKQCMTTVRIREALQNLPSDLDATYDRILFMINEEDGNVVRRALEWLVVAFGSIQLSQILENLSIDLEHRVLDVESGPVHGPALLDALGSLVSYNELTDVIILSHFSVKEYLTGELTRTKHPAYYMSEQAAHTQLALLSMCYISAYMKHSQRSSKNEGLHHDFSRKKIRRGDISDVQSHTKPPAPSLPSSEPHPFLEYVQQWGFHHLYYATPTSSVLLRAIKTLQSDVQQHPADWKRLCDRAFSFYYSTWPTLKQDFVLYFLVAFAAEPLLRLYIGSSKLELKDGTNPLIYAAYHNKPGHARILLSSGVSLDRGGWNVRPDFHQVLPLEVAVREGSYPVVILFLEEGSLVSYRLFLVALKERNSIHAPIVTRLLQTDQFVEWAIDIQDEDVLLRTLDPTRYPEHGSASDQDIDVIQHRLTQIGFDPYARFNETSLRRAASAGHFSIVNHYILTSNFPMPLDILLDASRSRTSNAAMLRLFLSKGCDPHAITADGDTALHLIMDSMFWISRLSEDDCLESVQVLVDAGCNPSIPNLDGDTPIHYAVRFGYISVIEYFLSRNATLPADILLVTPNFNLVSMTRLLVREGADMHAIAANGDNPIHSVLACDIQGSEQHLECTKVLIGVECDPCSANAFGESPLDIAAANRHLPVVEHLLSLNIRPSPDILLSVSAASFWRAAPTLIKLLIDKGADVHHTQANGDTLLHLSTDVYRMDGCLKQIEVLVNAGCDPRTCNADGKTPFHVAASRRFISVMEYLISIGTPIPSDIMAAVLQPCRWRELDQEYATVRFLLENQANIHFVAENGDGLLHLAVTLDMEHDRYDNALEVVKLLVNAGCNPCLLNEVHETPLHKAAEAGHIPIIDYFLSLPDVSLPRDILFAASRGSSDKAKLIRFLIDKGADPHVIATSGQTPLHLILADGNEDDRLECVKILVDAGCDPGARSAESADGKTPLHAAATHGFISVLEYFLSQGVLLPCKIFIASTRTIRFLLERGADVRSIATNYGDTASLMNATGEVFAHDDSFLERARFLVSLGLDFSSKDSSGETAFHAIVRRGDIPTLRYLLSQHVPLPVDVLLVAIPGVGERYVENDIRVIRFLVLQGADVNITTQDADTPLHLALRSSPNHEGIMDAYYEFRDHNARLCKLVEILLHHGSNPYARNADGQTPFDLADARGHFFKKNFLRLVQNSRTRFLHS